MSMPASAKRFKTLALVGNDRDARVVESMQILAAHLQARGHRVLADSANSISFDALRVERLPEDELAREADLLVAIGGDGTMLHVARLASPHSVPVLGINRGRLGFLADIGPTELRA